MNSTSEVEFILLSFIFFPKLRLGRRRRVQNQNVIPNPLIKQVLYFSGDDISLPCHSEAQRRISQVIANAEFEIPHFVSE